MSDHKKEAGLLYLSSVWIYGKVADICAEGIPNNDTTFASDRADYTPNSLVDRYLFFVSGENAGTLRKIVANTKDRIELEASIRAVPARGDVFAVLTLN